MRNRSIIFWWRIYLLDAVVEEKKMKKENHFSDFKTYTENSETESKPYFAKKNRVKTCLIIIKDTQKIFFFRC